MLVIVEVAGTPKQITWHRKGDYFATVAMDGELFKCSDAVYRKFGQILTV